MEGALTAGSSATLGDRLRVAERLLLLGRVVRRRVVLEEQVHVVVGQARHRVGLPDPARVEAHDVVRLADLLAEEEARELGILQPGRTGPTGVEDQGADLLGRIEGGHLAQGDLEGVAVRLGIVDRDLDASALVRRASLARLQSTSCGVEGGELCRVVGARRSERGRRRGGPEGVRRP